MSRAGVKRTGELDHDLFHALEAWLGADKLTVGARAARTLSFRGLDFEIAVNVRRAVGVAEVRELRQQAIDWLTKEPYRVDHCGCTKSRKERYANYHGTCTNPIVAAVAFRGMTFPYNREKPFETRFRFVCGVHREHHGLDLAAVLAVVELGATSLEPVRKLRAAERALAERRHRDEQRLRDLAREGKLTPAGLVEIVAACDNCKADGALCSLHEELTDTLTLRARRAESGPVKAGGAS